MQYIPERLIELYTRRVNNSLSPAESEELQQLMQHPHAEEFLCGLQYETWKEIYANAPDGGLDEEKIQAMMQSLPMEIETLTARAPIYRSNFIRSWGWVAASLLLILSVAIYRWMAAPIAPSSPIVAVNEQEIGSGHAGAILTLSNGSQMILDSLSKGLIAQQNGAEISLQNGQLTYLPTGAVANEVAYNTITTPKGRQFQMTLPDGTRVWLNAASSIRYPTAFTGNERQVMILGEVYFEVKKNAAMPFHVHVGNKAAIEVLGTHFNVNGYENEAGIYTTLLEGSVRVSPLSSEATNLSQNGANKTPISKNSVTLQPGQQAQLTQTMEETSNNATISTQNIIRIIDNVDVQKIMAWKNGVFNFHSIAFDAAMRQLERWYDIEVVYQNGIPENIQMDGKITRGVQLNDLLIVLKEIGVQCRLDGKRLLILKM